MTKGLNDRSIRILEIRIPIGNGAAAHEVHRHDYVETLLEFDHTWIMAHVLQQVTYKHNGEHDRGPHIGVGKRWRQI